MARARSQKMYLVERKPVVEEHSREFVVLGSAGNLYTVTISHMPKCNCPDFEKGNLCKHILFIYMKVLKVKREQLIYQKALLTIELQEIFLQAPQDPSANIIADKSVKEKYQEIISGRPPTEIIVPQKAIEPDDMCPVCYDTMSPSETLVFCKSSCGKSLHALCFKEWSLAKNGKPTCVYCRANWVDEVTPNKNTPIHLNEEGYINLAKYQHDINRERDTSSYSEWWHYHHY